MALNDTYHVAASDVADTGEVLIEGSAAETGAAEIHELGGTGDAEVYRETDTDGDGVYDVSTLIDEVTGEWHSQQNQLTVSVSNNHRLRIVNVSGGAADYYATGMEVSD